jgi:3-hydroxyisobutyrate dehydrogenase-like beta-hydroxyacid dehydrogenase
VTDAAQGAAGPRVAVLGIVTMGACMARNLLKAGLPVDVWNRTPEPAAVLAPSGRRWAPSAQRPPMS